MTVLSADRVHFQYGSGRGINGVSLCIERGACLGLLGQNGSGKTTLTRLVLGLLRPQAGSLHLFGEPPGGRRPSLLRRLGVVLDTDVHWDNLSGFQNALFVARSYGLGPQQAEQQLIRLFRMAQLEEQAHDPVATYSLGMRRKLSLVEALSHGPDLLVLDEPTAGLDPAFMCTLTDVIRQRCSAGRSTWVGGNDPEWLAGVASQVVFLQAGEIIAQGTVAQLTAALEPLLEAEITLEHFAPVGRPPMAWVRSVSQQGNEITILMERDHAQIPDLLGWLAAQGAVARAFRLRGCTLRDAFLLRTGAAGDL